jgi:hypothetical protein
VGFVGGCACERVGSAFAVSVLFAVSLPKPVGVKNSTVFAQGLPKRTVAALHSHLYTRLSMAVGFIYSIDCVRESCVL